MLQLARQFSKLSTTSPLSFLGLAKTFPAQHSLHTAATLQFQLTGPSYGSVAKKKKKQDPGKSNGEVVLFCLNLTTALLQVS